MIPAATASVVVLGDLIREYQLTPGETHEATIELENRDASPRTVRIYQTDYRYLANGETFFPAPGSMERSNAEWLTFSPKTLTIPSMQKSQARYLLRAPKEPSKTGTYWSMMMIQEVAEPSPARTERQESTVTNPPVPSRYGVQIVTQIEKTGKIRLEFTAATIESKNSKRMLSVDIENRGTKIARPEMWLDVYTGGGRKADRFIADKGTILPGCGIRREIDITSLPKGAYNSLFIADCGQKDLFGLEFKLILGEEPETKPLHLLRN